jgi:two-component system cell cycle response regulator DivK
MTSTLLLVDDHAVVRSGLRLLLEPEADFEIIGEAASGREAIRAVAERRPDIVLMDISMPVMDGLTATRTLKADAELRSIPVIALTALAMKGDEQRIRAAGCDGYISKPISTRTFLLDVRRYLPDGSGS